MIRRNNTDGTNSYKIIAQKELTNSNNITLGTVTVDKQNPVVQK